eukprot:CAMPEP_0118668926 /NCGR_PEP_ID=MMETSP0785-20121206/20616_1 /TAXON_ID=91992 /ORGANISM="Bolidomonas pacifica, Strain CCMP 1866" /LENGTH=686 /DNA_ID=CAMNT_0006563551 /DNA_START=149 /DNA_END=2209 /DNA_ORIENTATION=+
MLMQRCFLIFAVLIISAWARPVVRTIRDTSQFDKLLEKHATETGLPVILDFYSDSCGPCRMIAPAFKKLAKEYEGRAVFAKVDVNRQHEISGRYGVRSMPTFVFIVEGKKVNEFSGAGEQQLRQFTEMAVNKAERENVKLEFDDLLQFYAQNDAMKDEAAVNTVYQKCVEATNKKRLKKNKKEECVGRPASEMARKLKKKYAMAPKTQKRFAPQPKSDEAKPSSTKASSGSSSSSSSSSAAAASPNLHLATKEDLLAEIERRLEAEMEAAEEDETDDDDDEMTKHAWVKGDFPERVTIIGAGPAGLSAAIYAARAGLTPVVVAPPLGGQLQGKGVDVENYPGLANMTGPGVVNNMREQAIQFGTKFQSEEVLSVDTSKRPILVQTNTTSIETHTVIVATGADSKWLGVKGEWELRGGGVSSCATCDGFLFKDEHVVVVGGGDTAMEDALVLARTSKLVTVVHRRDTFRASKTMAERVLNHPDIRVVWNATVKEINGAEISVEGGEDEGGVETRTVVSNVVITDVNSGADTTLDCAAVFVAIGHSPNTKFLEGVVDYNPEHKGYLLTSPPSTSTSVDGIFAAGDSADAIYRQAITSAGSGAAAALDAERFLSERGLGNEEAEFQAELLREMMGESEGKEEEGGYNAYADSANAGRGRKESSKVEKKEKVEEKVEKKIEDDENEHIEL